ncbi:MAG: RNase 2 protein [Anaerolineales bacterium]|nr:RNase 2 protein [Anaerolineales bacterium]
MPSADLRTRLQRIRLQKVKRQLPPSVPAEVLTERVEEHRAKQHETEKRAALPGGEVITPLGAFQLIENRYPLDFVHGPLPLAALLARDPATAARLARNDALAGAGLRSLAFLDTETTGLAGGAGTLVFLVGVGAVEEDEFILRQYFLRDPGEEEAMLTALVQDLAPRTGWVTFNGRAFDLPLLETRLTLNRQRGALGQRPHLDLLMPARKLYQGRLASCSLGHIEQHVLSILRDQEDVPGALIPQMYQDYLRTRDASEMHRVIYHNAIDILSMVTLAAHLLEVFATKVETPDSKFQTPNSKAEAAHLKSAIKNLKSEDLLRLARWHDQEGRLAEAESAYRLALKDKLDLDARRESLMRFAGLLKRQERRAEAVPLWEQWASFSLDDPQPCVELAKYYEWHAVDLPKAIEWTERALKLVSGWPKGWQRDEALSAIRHRLERLKGKDR